jgi:hypothetical protein
MSPKTSVEFYRTARLVKGMLEFYFSYFYFCLILLKVYGGFKMYITAMDSDNRDNALPLLQFRVHS